MTRLHKDRRRVTFARQRRSRLYPVTERYTGVDNSLWVQWATDDLRWRGEATRNPLYKWQAVALILSEGESLPPWAEKFIQDIAVKLAALAAQCAGNEADHAEIQPPKLTAPDALKAVLPSLRLRLQTWNAFAAFKSDAEHTRDAKAAQWPQLPNTSPSQSVFEIVAGRRSKSDPDADEADRSVRRRIKQGMKLLYRRNDRIPLPL